MATRISAALTLTGSGCEPDEISKQVGTTPTETWKLGERIQNTMLRREHNGWSLSTGLQESDDLGQQMRTLLDQLRPYFFELKDCCTRWNLNAEIACVIYSEGEIPAIHFDHDIIEGFAELGAEIDVDFYILNPT